MKINLLGREVDLDDPIDLYFFHELAIWKRYHSNVKYIDPKDRYSKIVKKDFIKLIEQKADTGSWDFSKEHVLSYDTERFENVSDDFTVCNKKTDNSSDKLIIYLTSFAGHDGRLTNNLSSVSDHVINLDTDLIIVNENPYRMPERLFPAYMVLGVSEQNDTVAKTAELIKSYIKREYKKVIIYGDSKQCAATVALANELSDVVTHCFVSNGMATYSWDNSPYILRHLKLIKRNKLLNNRASREELEELERNVTDVMAMYFIKCYQFKQLNIAPEILEPFKHLKSSIKFDLFYGKYDEDYQIFVDYVKQIKNSDFYSTDNLNIHEIDFKISQQQTHNIQPHIWRNILPEYVNEA